MSATVMSAALTASWVALQARTSAKQYGHVSPEVMNDLIEAVRDLAVANNRITDEGEAMRTLEQRVAALEATAYRSEGQRSIGQDVAEIRQDVAAMKTRQEENGQMLRAIVVHLGLNPQ